MTDQTVTTLAPDMGERLPGRVGSEPVTLRRAVASEWIKFRTLRSSPAVLIAAMVAMLAVGLLVAYNTRHITHNLQAEDIAPSGPLQGYDFDQLLIGALGVLFVSGEYSTGMIRSTLTAVPRRIPVLWAKLIVFFSVTIVAMTVMSFVAFLAGEGLISHFRPGFSLSQPGVLRVVIGTGLYLTLVGVIGAALAWILRSTPGGLVAYVGVILVLPAILGNALGMVGHHIAEFLPSNAGQSFATSVPDGPSLSPGIGLGVMTMWAVIAIAAARVVLARRDA